MGDDLFLCSAKNILISIDAATGRENWRYDPQVSDEAIPYSASCRGVALYTAPDLPEDAPCRTKRKGEARAASLRQSGARSPMCWQLS